MTVTSVIVGVTVVYRNAELYNVRMHTLLSVRERIFHVKQALNFKSEENKCVYVNY